MRKNLAFVECRSDRVVERERPIPDSRPIGFSDNDTGVFGDQVIFLDVAAKITEKRRADCQIKRPATVAFAKNVFQIGNHTARLASTGT